MPRAPPPEARPPCSTREFAALTRWYPAGGAKGSGGYRARPPRWHRQGVTPPSSESQAQPERSKGLGHRSHAGPWHAIHAAPPPQQDLDHHPRVRKQSELAASLSRPTSPEPPGLRHHLISVRVGAGAARRVLQLGAGSAGDLLQPGPGPGSPREGSAALVPALQENCFDPKSHTSQLYPADSARPRTGHRERAKQKCSGVFTDLKMHPVLHFSISSHTQRSTRLFLKTKYPERSFAYSLTKQGPPNMAIIQLDLAVARFM